METNRNQYPNFQTFVFSGGAQNVTVNPSGGGTNTKQNTVVGGVVTTSTVGDDKPKSPCQVSMEDFDLLKVLGTGAYGKVFLARKKTGANAGQLFAMKVLKKQTIVQKRKTTEHTKTERQVLATIRQSPFLVTMHYAFQTPSKLHLVLGMLDIKYYRFLTTETNLKALYIFRCLFTTSSVKLFEVNAQIFVYNCVLWKKEKQHSLNLSHFENESTFQKKTTIFRI